MPDKVAVDFQEGAEDIRSGVQHLVCPIRARQLLGRLCILRSEHAMARLPTRRSVRISIRKLQPAKPRGQQTEAPVPLQGKFSKSGLEQSKRAAAVLCSPDRPLVRMRSVTYP
jgi:hypothetical protein